MAAFLQREEDTHQDGLGVGSWNTSVAVAVLADDDGWANGAFGQVVLEGDSGLIQECEQVVAMATTAPAKVINRAPKLGTLQVGAPGDASIMELVQGPVSFVDTRNNTRNGHV